MKKLVIGLSVVLASFSAAAQTNVSIYGVLDTGFQSYNTGATRITRMVDGALSTSRLGFRGEENLGGGLKATFQLEGGLTPSQGTVGTGGNMFSREAWVGIGHATYGEVRMGRQDVNGAQDVDTWASQAGNLGFHAVNGTAVELGSDQANVIKYVSPKIGGFTAQVGFASGNNAGTTVDAQSNQKGASLSYEAGALKVFGGFQKNEGATGPAERNFKSVGATYDFGVASAGVSHARGDVSTVGTTESKTTTLSVKVPMSGGLALHGVYAMAKDGSQATNGDGKGYTLAVTKSMSKRTTLYAAYTAVNNEANSSMSMTGTTAPVAAGQDTRATTVGINHAF